MRIGLHSFFPNLLWIFSEETQSRDSLGRVTTTCGLVTISSRLCGSSCFALTVPFKQLTEIYSKVNRLRTGIADHQSGAGDWRSFGSVPSFQW